VNSYDFYPAGKDEPTNPQGTGSTRAIGTPRTSPRKDIEMFAASAMRAHMKDFLAAIRTRGKPIADIEQGHIFPARRASWRTWP